jgi:hypothetical protein
VPEIQERDRVVVDRSWHTIWSDPTAGIPKGIYLVSQQAKLSIRRVMSASEGVIEISQPHSAKPERIKVGENGFTVHGLVIWYGRAVPPRHAVR